MYIVVVFCQRDIMTTSMATHEVWPDVMMYSVAYMLAITE